MGPGYRIMSKVKWIFGKYAEIKSQNFKHAISSGLNQNVARTLAFAPHLNIGVFSLEKNSEKTLSKGQVFGSEGLAINLSVYIDNVSVEFLPLYCNWIASNLLPKYDNEKNTFVEPNLPNYEIGIMHLAAGIWVDNKDMRANKSLKINIETLAGNKSLKSLRYEN